MLHYVFFANGCLGRGKRTTSPINPRQVSKDNLPYHLHHNKHEQYNSTESMNDPLIDWCLTSTLPVFQLYRACVVNKLYILDTLRIP